MRIKSAHLVLALCILVFLTSFPACRRKLSPEQWAREVKQKSTLSGHSGPILSLAISPKSELMASSDQNGKIILWDIKREKQIKEASFHNLPLFALAFSPDGRYLAGGGREKALVIYETAGMTVKDTKIEFPDMITALAWAKNGILACASCGKHDPYGWCTGGQISVFEFDGKLKLIKDIFAHEQFINALAFSPDNKYLVSGGTDHNVIIFETKNFSPVNTLYGHEARVNVLAFSDKDRTLLVSASLDRTLRLWNVNSGYRLKILDGAQGEIYGMAIGVDSGLIASGGKDRRITLWSAKTGEKLKTLGELDGIILNLGFTPDDMKLIAGLDNGEIIIFSP